MCTCACSSGVCFFFLILSLPSCPWWVFSSPHTGLTQCFGLQLVIKHDERRNPSKTTNNVRNEVMWPERNVQAALRDSSEK